MAFLQLSADEQAQVLARLASLVDAPVGQWPASGVKKLAGDELYLVPVNDDWRLFVQAKKGEEPEVLDVVRQQTLEAFAKLAGHNGN